MAESKTSDRVCLINTRTQPVELHLGASVHVLAAGQSVELDAAVLTSPQLAYLLDRKAIAVRAVSPSEPDGSDAATTLHRRGQQTATAPTRSPQSPKRKKEP
jgi:hypothetical protein